MIGMRTIAAVATLTLCSSLAWAQADEAEIKAHPDEAAHKVLGFTFGKPPPAEAVLSPFYRPIIKGLSERDKLAVLAVLKEYTAGVRYKVYALKHRWCDGGVRAVTDNNKVVMVRCEAFEPQRMHLRLDSRHGSSTYRSLAVDDRGSVWITPAGLCVVNLGTPSDYSLAFYWSRGETLEQCEHSRKTAKQGVDETIDAVLKAIVAEDAAAEDF